MRDVFGIIFSSKNSALLMTFSKSNLFSGVAGKIECGNTKNRDTELKITSKKESGELISKWRTKFENLKLKRSLLEHKRLYKP